MRIDPEVLAVRHPVLAAEMVKLQLEIGKRRIWARTYDGMRRCEGGRHQSPAEEKPFRTDFHAERQVSDEFVEAGRVPGLQADAGLQMIDQILADTGQMVDKRDAGLLEDGRDRSEERSVGKACGSPCRPRVLPDN